jgi:regulator of replication initiation timing
MEYKITIHEKGKTRVRSINIERVPYKVFKIAQRLERLVNETQAAQIEYIELTKEIQGLRKDKPVGWKETTAEKQSRVDQIKDQVFSVEDAGFFEERFEAIRLVLEANDIREGDELLSVKTWEEKMDYSDPMAFITFALQKDQDKKKLLTDALASTLGA